MRTFSPPRVGKSVPLPAATAKPAFTYAAGKPTIPDELKDAPRADGSMSDGGTGGNFALPAANVGPGSGPQIGLDGDPSK